ncbi:MAG: PAS domain S-box protein [Chlorobiaceae bacterium]|nr:PAS domain S-box protein [Chlorobiaceae bacterium]
MSAPETLQELKDLTYQLVFEENSEPKIIIDREGKILIANHAFAMLFNRTAEECIGMVAYSLLPRELAADRKKHADEAFRTGKRQLFEDERNGRFLRHSIYPVQGEHGEIDRVFIFVQDITELKLAETTSARHNVLSLEAMEAYPGSFTVLDSQGKIISCNSYFRDVIAGKKGDDLSGIDTFDLFHPDDKPLAYAKLIDILRKGTEESAELRVLIHGGPEYRLFRITTKRIVIGNEIFLVSSGTDIDEQKKKEQQLSLSNEKLRFILSQSKTGSWDWDVKTNTNKWSDEIWELYGLDRNAFDPTHENWRNLIIPEDRETVERQISENVVKGIPFRLEVRTFHPDGSHHWLLIRAFPFRDTSGSISRYVGIVIDITDLKESEEKLKKSDERFRRLFSEHSSIMLIIDAETDRILDANKAAEQFYGYTADELCSKNIEHLSTSTPETIKRQKAAIDSLCLRCIPSSHRRADGSIRDVEMFCSPDVIGDNRVYYVTIIDITERKRTEEKLKKLSFAVEQSPTVVVITDPKGNIEYANPTFTEHTGYTLEEAKGQNPRILQSGLMSGEFYENLWNTILSGKVWHGEFLNRKKNGELYWENAVISAIRNETGTITNFVAVKEDITEKKKLWDELLENKSKLEAALESMSDAVFITDLNGRFIEFNNAFATFHRFRNKQHYINNISDLREVIDFEMADGTPIAFDQRPVSKALRGENGVGIEYTLKRKDTGQKWIGSFNFAPIRDRKGNITGSVITGRDVTHLKKAEKAIQESEERFRKFFEQHSAAMMIIDPENGIIVDVNNAAAEYYGWSREQLIRMSVIDLNTDKPEDTRKRLEGWKNTSNRSFTVTHRKADGTSHDIEVFGQKIQVQQRWLAYLILHDITERNQYQQALVESNERVHYILNAATAGIWETFLGTHESKWSEEIWRIFDIEQDSLDPSLENWMNTIIAEDRESVELDVIEAVNNGTEFNSSWRMRDSRGNLRWFLCKGNPVRNADGKIEKFVGITLDITERKRIEEEYRALELRMLKSQRLETIGTLAGGIAHDFNNILTPILGFAELGAMKVPETNPLQEYFREIMIAAERAQNLVSQILTFGKEKVSEPVIVSMQSIVEEALQLLHPSIPADIRIEQRIDPSCRNILADPSKIHQVIVNLCTNACHAMEKSGGTLSLSLDEVIPDTNLLKRLPDLQDQPYTRLTVTDTGCGMDKMTMDHIFEPFYTTKPVNKGTGLGLSVVHGIISGYKGVIDVESEPEKGSSFHIYLPLVDKKITFRHRNDDVPKGNARILFIDDEETTLKIVTIMITELGHRVRALNSPRKAIELFRQSPDDFDLVITDLTMPEMTGFDLASEIHECRPDMPVILMTGYGKDMDNAEELKKHGISQVLKKPVKVETLVTAINHVLYL